MDTEERTPSPPPPQARPQRTRGGKKGGSFLVSALVALIVIACGLGVASLFGSEAVAVRPLAAQVAVDTALVVAPSPNGDAIPYRIVTLERTETESVAASGEEEVRERASGTIVVSNTAATSQRLIKNTRFEAADGKVFRIQDSIVVPKGTPALPGRLEVTVYADQPGDSYNIAPTTFTLPGLKGSASFSAVTAASSAAMSGGFVGKRPVVSAEDRSAARGRLQQKLSEDLARLLEEQVPEGYVLLAGATKVAYAELPSAAGASGTADIREQATARAVVLPSDALGRHIARVALQQEYGGEAVRLAGGSGLTLAGLEAVLAAGDAPADVRVSGTAELAWVVAPEDIAREVAGKTRDEAQALLQGFAGMDAATIRLVPFWVTSFPEDPSQIDVTIEDPAE